jgi:signal transduction histidine kinase
VSVTTPPRSYVVVAVLIAGAGAATATIWFVARSSVVVDPQSVGILRGILVASWIAAGTYMWRQRPESRLGFLVAGTGFLYAATSLMASDNQLTFTIGRIVVAVFVLCFAYVYLCFPGDRIVASRDRLLIGALAVATLIVWPFVLALSEQLPAAGALNECGSRCPSNALRIASVPDRVTDVLNDTVGVVTAVGGLAIVIALASKARSRLRLRRRAVEPVLYAFGIVAASYVANSLGNLSGGMLQAAQIAAVTGALLTPIAMVAGQAWARWYAFSTLGRLVIRGRAEHVTPARVQEWLRDGLGDPTLELALWDRLRLRFVDIDGRSVDFSEIWVGRTVTPVIHDGRPVAALAHNASLRESADLVEGLAETALMLLENERLVDELRASRARIVASADEERHRLERDLHDGAQQRIFLLEIKLRRLRDSVADDKLVDKLEELEDDATAALEELRVLAHGIYPTVLVERGVPEALRAFAIDAPIPVDVIDHWVGRCSPTIEAALYFCALEAIQNAAKHAGAGARVTVDLDRDGDRVDLSIADDGVGFQAEGSFGGLGFVTMRDRIGAVGGELEIASEPGAGVTVHITIPEAPLRSPSEVSDSTLWRSA